MTMSTAVRVGSMIVLVDIDNDTDNPEVLFAQKNGVEITEELRSLGGLERLAELARTEVHKLEGRK